MRHLLIAALLLAGLVAPPAVLAQVGSPPGVGSPPFSTASPTFTGTATFGLGTCASTSANFGPLTGLTASIGFVGKTDGLCYDTGADANTEGMAFVHGGRMYGKFALNGGLTLFGSSVGGLGGGKVFSTSASGGTLWGPDPANATPYTPSAVAAWSFTTAQTPNGQFTLAKDSGIAFQGATNNAVLTYLYVDDPTVTSKTIVLPDASGTVLVSTTANTPDTGNAVWANTGSFLFEGSTANGFETELDTVDPTADRLIYLPDASGTVALTNSSGQYTTPIVSVGDGGISHSFNAGSTVELNEGSATSVVLVTPAENEGVGLQFQYVIYAADAGGDRQYRTGFVSVSIFNNAGTAVCGVGTPNESVAVTSGTLTATVDCNVAGGGAQIRLNATSSLTQTTLNAHGSVRSMSFSTTPPTVSHAGGA